MNLKDLPPEERMKIVALLAEKKSTKGDSWMYEKPKEDPEAFLLGKQVQSLSQIQEISKEYEESPAQRLARFDMEAKFREDPLTIMKQREAEKRMELLKNTAKIKKLRRLLTEQKLRKEKHKSKKHSKRRHHHKSSDESEEMSSDDELLNKFIKIIHQSDEMGKVSSQKSPTKYNNDSYDTDHKQSSSSSNQRHAISDQNCSNLNKKHSLTYNQRNQSMSSNSERSDYRKSSTNHRKLSKEEIEAKRAQMISDAKEHEKQRSHRSTTHYTMKNIEEKKELASKFSHGPSFISHLKNQHVDMTTVEEGIHRKASSRQRGELHDNFIKR
ncbi:unnamed protein product [Schistosoma turkestanicum]|nr:unnamed protein product [Schistosoma turkestanicum]